MFNLRISGVFAFPLTSPAHSPFDSTDLGRARCWRPREINISPLRCVRSCGGFGRRGSAALPRFGRAELPLCPFFPSRTLKHEENSFPFLHLPLKIPHVRHALSRTGPAHSGERGSRFPWRAELGCSHNLHREARTLAGASLRPTRASQYLGTHGDGVAGE